MGPGQVATDPWSQYNQPVVSAVITTIAAASASTLTAVVSSGRTRLAMAEVLRRGDQRPRRQCSPHRPVVRSGPGEELVLDTQGGELGAERDVLQPQRVSRPAVKPD